MRKLGTLSVAEGIDRFRDYLFIHGIETRIERQGTEYVIWVLNEDQIPQARAELQLFQQNPDDPRFREAVSAAQTLREKKLNEEIAAQRQRIDVRKRWLGHQRRVPVTAFLVMLSVWVAVVTHLGSDENTRSQFMMADWVRDADTDQIVAPTLAQVFENREYLRWFAPIFLHFGPLHLLFNMSATLAYGRAIEQRSGSLRMLGIVAVIALVSNFSQLAMSGPNFGGMSGVDFGLFGFLWMKSRFAPDYGVFIGRDYVRTTLFFGVMCLSGALGPVANTAHFTGMFTGMALAMIPLIPRIYRRYFTK